MLRVGIETQELHLCCLRTASFLHGPHRSGKCCNVGGRDWRTPCRLEYSPTPVRSLPKTLLAARLGLLAGQRTWTAAYCQKHLIGMRRALAKPMVIWMSNGAFPQCALLEHDSWWLKNVEKPR